MMRIRRSSLQVFNFRGEMLGIDGLARIIEHAATLPLAKMKEHILNAVADWRSGPATDDVSLVLVEIP